MDNLKIAVKFIKRGRMHIGLLHRIMRKKQLYDFLTRATEIEEGMN